MKKYLGKEVLGQIGDWIVVFDGKYNYMLFNVAQKENIRRYKLNWMPTNNVNHTKNIEYYSTLENALRNLEKVAKKGKFLI